MLTPAFSGRIRGPGIELLLVSRPLSVGVRCASVGADWVAGLLAAVVLAGCTGSVGDEVDVASAQYFVNSSLAPVVLFRRRLKSVADVLEGIRNKGFTQSVWSYLFP